METVSQQKLKVAINGFGRIGRNFLRCWNGRESSLLDVVAINDSGGVKQVSRRLGPGGALLCHCPAYMLPLGDPGSHRIDQHRAPDA
jgi:Glyceraldehyde 3-phosphate dehydrogenase, NAD binding domain